MSNNQKPLTKKEKIDKFGEVFTNEREVNAMLDMCGRHMNWKEKRIDYQTKILEPTCGDGAFLVKIYERKFNDILDHHKNQLKNLKKIKEDQYDPQIKDIDNKYPNTLDKKIKAIRLKEYKKAMKPYWDLEKLLHKDIEKKILIAVSTVYGIEYQEDNLIKCRERLKTFIEKKINEDFPFINKNYDVIALIIEYNIMLGDSLKMVIPETDKPILFTKWDIDLEKDEIRYQRYHMLEFGYDKKKKKKQENKECKPVIVKEEIVKKEEHKEVKKEIVEQRRLDFTEKDDTIS
jgi:hypothetical protein